MFDQIPPVTQAVTQIPQKHSSKRMTVFELIEANGLTLHGDIEHFAELVRADEREAILAIEASSAFNRMYGEFCPKAKDLADAIRARGQA
jgi:hypothetical protein